MPRCPRCPARWPPALLQSSAAWLSAGHRLRQAPGFDFTQCANTCAVACAGFVCRPACSQLADRTATSRGPRAHFILLQHEHVGTDPHDTCMPIGLLPIGHRLWHHGGRLCHVNAQSPQPDGALEQVVIRLRLRTRPAHQTEGFAHLVSHACWAISGPMFEPHTNKRCPCVT